MVIRSRLTPDETREQILAVAEEHFRRIGYGKTAIADLAEALGMSPANVYRFFPSKGAIVEAICLKLLTQGMAIVRTIVDEDAPAADRLERMVLAMHHFNKSNYTSERRVHDMVTAAMEENWAAIEAHYRDFVGVIAEIIADGVRRGEFPPQDVMVAALTVKNMLVSVMHPTLIASCSHLDLENQAVRITRFVIAGLRAAPALPVPSTFPFPASNAAE